MATNNSVNSNMPIEVTDGGTGVTTLTDNGVLVGSAAAAITPLAVGTNGQVLLGSVGADPVFGTLTSSDATITFTTGAGTLSLQADAAISNSFVTDVGTATPAVHVITIEGGTNLNSAGAGSTVTVNLDASIAAMTAIDFATAGRIGTATGLGNTLLLQAYDVDGLAYTTFATLTANNIPTMDLDDAVTKASQYIYRAAGTDVPVTDGGTGGSSLTAYSVLCGGTTATNPVQPIAGIGAAGEVLTSNGVGALPTFQASGGAGDVVGPGASTDNAIARFDLTTGKLIQNSVVTIDDSGNATGFGKITTISDVVINTGLLDMDATAAAVGQIVIGGSRVLHTRGTNNTFFGANSGNLTLSGAGNTAIGTNAGAALGTNNSCVLIGHGAGDLLSSGNNSVAVGKNSLAVSTNGVANVCVGTGSGGALTSGTFNTHIGENSGATYTTGSYNCFLGNDSGLSATTSSSSNICIMNTGAAESNTCRIGTQGAGNGQIDTTIIAGIYNTAVGATAGVVLSDSTHQLGGLAGATNTILVGGTKPSFTDTPTIGDTLTVTNTVTSTSGDFEAAAATKGFICGSGLKVIDGAGSPDTVVTAPKGSLYLRTDGTGTGDRAYINTNGTTGWTALTTAA